MEDTTNQAEQTEATAVKPISYREMVMGMAAMGLPLSGWKHGTCSYCSNTKFPEGTDVMVHKLPNSLVACLKCYKRPQTVKKRRRVRTNASKASTKR